MDIRVMTAETASEAVNLPDGSQVGTARVLCDSPLWAGLWECEPKSWAASFDSDETMFVIEGELRFDTETDQIRANSGEAVFFPKGATGTMTVGGAFRAWVVVT